MRYYEKKFPRPQDRVVVRVVSFSDMGAYVSLLEYDGIEGMIPMIDLSNRAVKKATSIGNIEVAIVTVVDEEKGYIDLTKKGVTLEDVIECEKRWTRARWIERVIERTDPEKKVYQCGKEIDSDILMIQSELVLYTARVDVMFYRYNKVDSIKEGFLAGLSATSDIVSIQVDQSPSYKITLYTDRAGEIDKVCKAIIEKIIKLGGEAIER